MNNLEPRLIELVTEQCHNGRNHTITPASTLSELGLDMLDLLSIIALAETEFDVEISDADLDGIRTVADLIRVIRESE